HWHQVDDRAEQLLTENTYNELSQLINKKVGNNLQSMDYAYNIRGWMTEINKNDMSIPGLNGKLFSYRIKYNQKDGTTNPDTSLFVGKNVKPMYNGNIAEVDWRSVESLGANPPLEPKRYGYAYDALNRLTAGYYQNPNNPWSKEHTEVVDYDLNGNIIKLYRTSVMNGTTAEVIDELVYNYGPPTSPGNRLLDVKDNRHNKAGYEGGGNIIAYDANGNMTNMLDKQILGINYNYLNLPKSITRGANFNINHLYRADGVKLHKSILETYDGVNGTVNNTTDTDYLDGFQYIHTLTQGGGSPGGGGSPVEEADFAISPMRKAMEIEAYTMDGIINPLEPGIDPTIGGGGVIVVPAKDEDLVFFPTAEGYYDYKKDQYIYQYKDHLGNVRVSFGRNSAGALEIVDANDYYPFGMNHLKTGNAFYGQGSYKNYKYNGKELQETGMYDYEARFYMPDLGRWGVVDPLAEKYSSMSTFAYVANNPIIFVDPDGKDIIIYYMNSKGKMETYDYKYGAQYKGTNKYVHAFHRSANALIKSGAGNILKSLESKSEKVWIRGDNLKKGESPDFDPVTMTIRWSPTTGVNTDGNADLTPTEVLNHEMDHGLEYITDPEKFYKDLATPDKKYGNNEEKRVITGSEKATARKMKRIKKNETTRTNHDGSLIPTAGVTTTQPPATEIQEVIIKVKKKK
ncbi:RHS repeat-associated core domain-containing protein, partial [Chryseobacterium joostei]|uniref:RHS repeat-associated core domain-containing protein n=1 Tax=Chryseobacterium joostei TaxID=112234 RepID=UPI0023F258E7